MANCEGCCVFPHGRMSIYALVMSISAYLFTISSTWGCYYMEVEASFSRSFQGLTVGVPSGVGLFTYEDVLDVGQNTNQLSCYYYSTSQIEAMDGSFKAARAFGMIGNVFAGGGMIALIAISCVDYPSIILRLIGFCMVCASVCQSLTFLLFNSRLCDFDCKFFVGAGMAIGGVIVSLATAVIVLRIPPAEEATLDRGPEQPPAYSPGTKTVAETVLPDGTRKITTTIVHADGSKTIEEEIQVQE